MWTKTYHGGGGVNDSLQFTVAVVLPNNTLLAAGAKNGTATFTFLDTHGNVTWSFQIGNCSVLINPLRDAAATSDQGKRYNLCKKRRVITSGVLHKLYHLRFRCICSG